jgi:hypothetical protein
MKLKPKKNKVILETENKTITDSELTHVSNLIGTIEETQKSLDLKEEAVKTTKDFLRKLTEEDLPNKLAEIGLTSVETKNGDKVTIKPFYRGHISKEKQAAAYKWLRENNHADLIKNEVKSVFGKGEDALAINIKEFLNKSGISFTDKESVHPQSLSAFIREQTEKGKALPHDLLGVHIGQIAKIKRGE